MVTQKEDYAQTNKTKQKLKYGNCYQDFNTFKLKEEDLKKKQNG